MSDDLTDEEPTQEPGSLSGDVEPVEPGEWLTLDEAGARLGIDRKAVYRRIRRGKMIGKKAPGASHLLVWFPTQEPGSPEEQRSLAVPTPATFLAEWEAALNRAVAPLNETITAQQARIEELARENERLILEREQRSRQGEQLSWWRRLLGYN